MKRREITVLVFVLLAGCGGSEAKVHSRSGSGDAGTDAGRTLSAPDAGARRDAGAADTAAAYDAGTPPCTDLEHDSLNCGACGRDCQGAACVAGACGPAPRVLASRQSPTYLGVDATNVYWVNALPTPRGVAGHAQVMRCAIDGCDDQPAMLWDGLYPVDGIAVQEGAVWWPIGPGGMASTPFGRNPGIVSCATGGCANTPSLLLSLNVVIRSFASDDAQAYWGGVEGIVNACALQGCGGSAMSYAPASYEVNSIGVNSTSVFWIDMAGRISSCPRSGCTGSPTLVATTGLYAGLALAADEQNIYWIYQGRSDAGEKVPPTKWSNGGVFECPVTGCSGTSKAIALYPDGVFGGALVVDATDVYWSTKSLGGYSSEIVKCAIGGCDGKPTPVGAVREAPESLSATSGLAIDATHVYWTDPGRGAVMAAAK